MMRAITIQCGTAPICGKTIHGATLRTISTKESVKAVTSGSTSVAWTTAINRS